jgi:hypothetical protein
MLYTTFMKITGFIHFLMKTIILHQSQLILLMSVSGAAPTATCYLGGVQGEEEFTAESVAAAE